MTEFEISGVQYKFERLDTFKQLHLARRLAPALSGILAAFANGDFAEKVTAVNPDDPTTALKGEDLVKLVEPLANAFSVMPDADVELVIKTCLKVVSRNVGGDRPWAPIATPAGALLYNDIELPDMLQITWKVLEGNLGRFFAAARSVSPVKTSE